MCLGFYYQNHDSYLAFDGSRPRTEGIDIAALKFSTLRAVLALAIFPSHQTIEFFSKYDFISNALKEETKKHSQVDVQSHMYWVEFLEIYHWEWQQASKLNYVHLGYLYSYLRMQGTQYSTIWIYFKWFISNRMQMTWKRKMMDGRMVASYRSSHSGIAFEYPIHQMIYNADVFIIF